MTNRRHLRETLLISCALGVLAAVLFAPHLQHGGFYMDDWSNGARALQPPANPDIGKAVSAFVELTLYRPVLVVYVPIVYVVLGSDMQLHLAWALVLAVLASIIFYGLLRTTTVPWPHALLLAALALVFPWSDSTRLWATADQVTLTMIFMGAGLLVALRSLDRPLWPRHATAAVLYLLSILAYEITLPLIACLGFLYWARGGWKIAKTRWLIDLAAVALGGAWTAAHTPRVSSGPSAWIDHLGQIVNGGGEMIGRSAWALGSPRTTLALCILAAILTAGLVALVAFPNRFRSGVGWGLRNWLVMAFVGLAVASLAWVVFVPADPYYTPTVYGEVNRVNGLAAPGLILLVYGSFGVLAALLGGMRGTPRWLPAVGPVVLAIALFLSYAHVLRRHISIWDSAFMTEKTILGKIKQALPDLRGGSHLILTGNPANQTLGVPIFASSWDLDGAIKLKYNDSTLSARPLMQGTKVVCLSNGVELWGTGVQPEPIGPYGTVWFFNVTNGRILMPRNSRQCGYAARDYRPGPLYLSVAY